MLSNIIPAILILRLLFFANASGWPWSLAVFCLLQTNLCVATSASSLCSSVALVIIIYNPSRDDRQLEVTVILALVS